MSTVSYLSASIAAESSLDMSAFVADTTASRHAYLIMAHNNPAQLGLLLTLLDHSRNDIFLHIDKKSRELINFRPEDYLEKSGVYVVDSLQTNWGSASLVLCEINLLKAAVSKGYVYYHLISGADMPLKSQDSIHQFFDRHAGAEFIHFDAVEVSEAIRARVNYYHVFQEYIGRFNKKGQMRKLLSVCDACAVMLQKLLGVARISGKPLAKGAQWFSITHELVCYILAREQWVLEFIRFSVIPDELFLQSLVVQSPFRHALFYDGFDNNYWACLRYIDWQRGTPYVFREADFLQLVDSNYLFARKFDPAVDGEVINKIVRHLRGCSAF